MLPTNAKELAAALKSTKVPRYDAAVAKGVAYLTTTAKLSERDETLAAYALLKAGVETSAPIVAKGITIAKERAGGGRYTGYDHIYLAGVDAMLLADADQDAYFSELQTLVNYVQSAQRADGSWSDSPRAPGDVSMTQYGVLALWAAQRANCKVAPDALDRAGEWLMKNGNGDGGWGYRPGHAEGPGKGASTHNMTLAAAGSIAVSRTLLHGPKNVVNKQKEEAKFGVLEKVQSEAEKSAANGSTFPGYNARTSAGSLDDRVQRAFGWNQARFSPVSKAEHKIYFYYALERAAALGDAPEGWFTTYGDGLLTLQSATGEFATHSGPSVGTSLAILYFMRSTQQILDKQYGTGMQAGGRGLDDLFGKKEKKKKEMGPLDELLGELEKADLSKLDNINTDDIVQKVQFGSKEELIGQVDNLKLLLKSKDPTLRQTAYFALGRTGDFSLIPEMLQGLRDENLDVNVEALNALRYISRKPNGFGMPIDPLAGGAINSDEQKLLRANNWRTKAYKLWAEWYREVRPYEDGGGLDELELLSPTVGVK
ncbi:MAG: hypothetical protein WAO83_02560 [Fuerstiella sp.]